MKTFLFCLVSTFFVCGTVCGQFFSVKSDSTRIRPYRIIKGRPSMIQQNIKQTMDKEYVAEKLEDKDTVPPPPPQIIIRDTIFGKLQERLTMCLPLDLLKMSSKYGVRKDPITRCAKFHDGVDFACEKEYVYSMLPAVVKKVHKGNKGYGNYVILKHGRLECLYGHLETITVKEKEIINAGTIVGISGNTGKSTGYHLHVRLRNNGKSVDPANFINFLRAYIQKLNKDLSMVVPPKRSDLLRRESTQTITLKNLYSEIIRKGILFPKIVLAQAVLETGYFSSRVCLEHNNLFGLRRPSDGSYYHFDRWEDSVTAYRDYVQYKYRGGDYFAFLNRIGYAEDRNYTFKVKNIVDKMKEG